MDTSRVNHLAPQFLEDLRILPQELPGFFPTLPQLVIAVRQPRATAVDDPIFERHVDHVSLDVDPAFLQQVKLRLPEWRRDLVLHHLHFHPNTNVRVPILQRADLSHVHPHRRVKFQRPPPRRRLGTPKHHPDLLANLVDENHAGLRLGDRPGQLPHRLAHHPRLQTDVRIADVAIQFGLWHQRRHRVDHNAVDRVRLDEHLGDLERLFPVGGLTDQQIFQVDPQPLRPGRVERVLGVDERRHPSQSLRVGNHMQRQRRLATRFRSVHLDDAAPRKTFAPQCQVKRQRPRRNPRDRVHVGGIRQTHDRPLAERLLNLPDGVLQDARLGTLALAGFLRFRGLTHGAPHCSRVMNKRES